MPPLLRQKNSFLLTTEDEAVEVPIEEDAINRLSAEEILKIITQLPPGYRTVFNLFTIEGMSHKEIAKALGITGKEQLRSYCNATGSPVGVWSNGGSISYYHRKDPNYFEDITDIPTAHQTLSDVLNERFTIDDLIAKDKLINEKK